MNTVFHQLFPIRYILSIYPKGYNLKIYPIRYNRRNSEKVHALPSCRIQGVCFRMATRDQAMLFGLTGWVRNLADGRVEVMASGEEEQLKLLHAWLKRGPEMARGLEVKGEEREDREFEGFSVR